MTAIRFNRGEHVKKGLVLAFGSYIAWGFLSIFWKLLSGVDAYEVFSYRMLSTMLTMLLYFLLFGKMDKLKTEVSGLIANKSELVTMILASFLISVNWLVLSTQLVISKRQPQVWDTILIPYFQFY